MPTQLMFESGTILERVGALSNIILQNEIGGLTSTAVPDVCENGDLLARLLAFATPQQIKAAELGIEHLLKVVYGCHDAHKLVLSPGETAGERLCLLRRGIDGESKGVILFPTELGVGMLDAIEAIGVKCPITID